MKKEVEKKKTVEDVREGIQETTKKIDGSRYKAYILQQLFDNEAGNVTEDISIDHIGLLFEGAQTILGEIVADIGEASEYLSNLRFSDVLKQEVQP